MSKFRLFILFPLLSLFLISCASSKRTATSDDKAAADSTKTDKDAIKAFNDVIKDDFEKDEGLFNVYKDDATFFYEIPNDRLDQEFLLVTRIARTANNIGYGGMKANTQVVR